MVAEDERSLLEEVSALIASRMGLHFPEDRWPDLARSLRTAGEELGFDDPEGCLRWIRSHQLTTREIETLASHLTVGETYFLRDPASFDVFERELLRPLIKARRDAGKTLRLWSAGCCSGEEAYSLAISCVRALPDLHDWNVSILATDINTKFLAKAARGAYSPWSFRGAPDWLRTRFFTAGEGKDLVIDPAIRRLVRFDYLNLAEDAYPSLHNGTNAMDVIFCRNVLMYFTKDHQAQVLAGLHRCLVDGGHLLVNPAEASTTLYSMFAVDMFDGVIAYRKTAKRSEVGRWPSVPAASALPDLSSCSEESPPEPDVALPPAIVSPEPIAPSSDRAPEDYLALARDCANQGRLQQALEHCQRAIAADRTDPTARFLCATIFQELGRIDEALKALREVLYLDQDFILAHHALGSIYRRHGKEEQSKRHFAIALELLSSTTRDAIVPASEGMTSGRLEEAIRAMEGT